MPGIFHWLRIQTFCYPTEREDLVAQAFAALTGTDGFETVISDSEQGSRLLIYQTMLTKQKDFEAFFRGLGPAVLRQLRQELDERVDDDDVFYTRLDKQQAVQGVWAIGHHGDVIAITGKVAANPARKDVAVRVLDGFLTKMLQPARPAAPEEPSSV